MGIETAIATAILGKGIIASTAAGAALISFGVTTAVGTALSFGLNALQSALVPKPSGSKGGDLSSQAQGITQNVKQAITTRRHVYGEMRVGGAITYMETTSNNDYLHIILVIADHEVEEIGEIWLDDESIPQDYVDTNGNVITGTYKGVARFKKHLGTLDQSADLDLIEETLLDVNFIGRGVSYLYGRLEYDRDVYPSSVPVISAFVKGKRLYDPRDGQVRFSNNAALIANDYMVSGIDALATGVGVDQGRINASSLVSSANVCDEDVLTKEVNDTILSASGNIIRLEGVNDRLQYQVGDKIILVGSNLPAGLSTGIDYFVIPYQRKGKIRVKLASSYVDALAGNEITLSSDGEGTMRKISEPRYSAGGIIDTANDLSRNLNDVFTAMGGYFLTIGEDIHINSASYRSGSIEFDEVHIISPIITRTKNSRRDRFNVVKGVYVSPINDGEAADYPLVKNTTYIARDGDEIAVDYDLSMTQRHTTAQRLAKIKLEKHRQEQFIEADFTLHALLVKPGDVILFSNIRLGVDKKEFEVVKWALKKRNVGNAPLFYVRMSLQETSSAVYDWNNGEETVVDPAPNSYLASALVVEVVSGFSLDSEPTFTHDGDKIFNITASWDIHDNKFVSSGGNYEIQYKISTDSIYSSIGLVDGSVTHQRITALKPDVLYDLRIYAYNNLGVRSQPTVITGFLVGQTVTSNSEDWEHEELSRNGDDWESDDLISEDWEA